MSDRSRKDQTLYVLICGRKIGKVNKGTIREVMRNTNRFRGQISFERLVAVKEWLDNIVLKEHRETDIVTR